MPIDLTTRRSAISRLTAQAAAIAAGAPALAASSDTSPVPASAAGPGTVNLLDVIPPELRQAGADGRTPPEVSRYLQAALASLGERGGLIQVPSGAFRLAETINLPRRTRIVGVGRASSIFEVAHNGDGFRCEAPINAFTPVNIGLEQVGLVCLDNRMSNGAGFSDRGGTYVALRDVLISGFKYGCVLDQTELASVESCQIEYPREAAIWLVNGPDRNAGAQTTYTNRISVVGCQINQADGFGIIDDGGRSHSFRDNNFNGCRLGHLRLAGYGEYVVDGNYFEESAGPPVIVSNRTYSGRNVQRPNSVVLSGNLIIAQPGRPSIVFEGATAVAMMGNTLVGERAPSVRGLNTVESLVSNGNAINNPAGFFEDSRAARRQQSSELALDRFERIRLAPFPAGGRRTLRIEVPDARAGDMALVSFEPALPLRAFMPVAETDAVAVELENPSLAAPTGALDVLVRIRLLKA